ncbi:MAG: NUDIX hydrolase [Candidatus Kaiserbacteria bacterium]|nr:NUDIX hydrolase [Candidatus Kaiserbacteria bacterium]
MDIKRPASKQPLPENAKKVFSGTLFDVYQWDQKMYDGSTVVFEKLKRPDTVTVFPVLPDGRILLTKQEQPGKAPFIGAAGGRVDDGEDILAAAKRELLEETGYEAGNFDLWMADQPISKVEWAVYVFIAKGVRKVAEPHLDAGEKIELMSVSFDEFLRLATEDHFIDKEILARVHEARLDPNKMEELRRRFSL